MTGSKFNNQKGQVLLITVMILATILSIVIATSFSSMTETQLTKLEEEERKAFAAAEAVTEKALKEGSTTLSGIGEFSNYQASATVDTTTSRNFITPLLQKDEQYTLYLSTPQGAPDNPNFQQLGSPYFSGNLYICFNNAALELTLIKSDNTVSHYAVNPSGSTIIQNALSANSGATNCPDTSFNNNYLLSSVSNTKLLLVRVIGGSSKVGFHGTTDLRLQGKTIYSKATSPGGATKKIVLFQSYPQIPSDFFVTSF